MAAEGLRPILARDTPPQLARLLEDAWQLQPEPRPTAAQLAAELKSVVEQLSSSSQKVALSQDDTAANGISTDEAGALEPRDRCPG